MSRRRVIVVCVIYLAVTVYLDWITGPAVSLTVFYVLPVGLLTWLLGKRAGYVLAIAAALLWFAIDFFGLYKTWAAPLLYWNTIVRFGMMGVIAWLVDECHKLTKEIAKHVEAKTANLKNELAARQEAENAVRLLATRVSEAEEGERKRLAQDLHDRVGQDLTALRLMLQTEMECAQADPAAQRRLGDACGIIERVIVETRGMTRELYPAMLDDLGLVATLRGHAEQFGQRTGIQVSVTATDVPEPLPTSLAHFLYQAVKELINNAAKHGRARQVMVHLRGRNGQLRAIVDDDGCGMSAAQVVGTANLDGATGLGLARIRQRLQSLGGKLEIESTPNSGVRVMIDLPTVAASSMPKEST